MKQTSNMNFKPLKIKPSLFKELKKEGLISIEEAEGSNVKILSTDNLNSHNLHYGNKCKNDSKNNESKKKLSLKRKKDSTKSENQNDTTLGCISREDKKIKIEESLENDRLEHFDINNNNNEKIIKDNNFIEKRKRKRKRGKKKKKIINSNMQINTTDNNLKKDEEGEGEEEREQKNGKKRGQKKSTENVNISNINSSSNENSSKKKELFNIERIIKTEEELEKDNNIKYKIHCNNWNNGGKIFILHNVMKSLFDNAFFKPTEIQSKTLEKSINDKNDIVVISKTGTGKTLTFCLPILNNILINKLKEYKKKFKNIQKFRCLILVPTRELALQILKHFNYINKYINLFISTIIGGLNLNKQKRILRKKPEILICTPGRLKYFLHLENPIKYIYEMKNIRYLVCDEIDKMIEISFMKDISYIAKHIYKSVGDKKKKLIQTFLLSATLSLTVQLQNDNMTKLLNSIIIRKDKSFIINLSNEQNVYNDNSNILPELLTLYIVKLNERDIVCKLFYLIKSYFSYDTNNKDHNDHHDNNKWEHPQDTHQNDEINKIIIFVNTIKSAKQLNAIFKHLFLHNNLESSIPKKYRSNLYIKNKLNIYSIHSKQKLKERLENINKFSQQNHKAILFCTDVLSRGIDLDKCDLIIQLNCPISDITFVHRSGRTARNFRKGKCICFITETEIYKWKTSLEKVGINIQDLQELDYLKSINEEDYAKINKAIECANKMIEFQDKLILKKKDSLLKKLAREAELDDEDEEERRRNKFYSDSENEYEHLNNQTIYKNILHLKKELYNTLYKQ
ncbi:RNA helicase, putative [Plasmodium reichenowi]|uniref:ATP-dependent RNA helicase n=1 Tax=Plasmodium reichenowi TaxID=5854 RepID=A0A151L563_PLARE|nr:RNA helicase, putative [Plasmodium reichenowi]KYN94105.1 RNA helicase, putative [Plasmodium reichenowi]